MGISRTYRTGSNVTPSFDYFDYAIGQAYRSFYLGASKDGTSTKYFITSAQPTSAFDVRRVTNGATYSFDITFNTFARISGVALINFTIEFSGGAPNAQGYLVFEFVKVHDGSETSLVTVTGNNRSSPSAYFRELMQATIPDTSFTSGDILRIKATPTAGTANVHLHIDPSSIQTAGESTTSATIPRDCKISLPFILDL